ncbi:MAG: T9SS type A sorting domain-containing protein [Saprospiraceae bacterium]
MNNCTVLIALIGLLSWGNFNLIFAQVIPTLELETEKSALLAGEEGIFTLTITNNDAEALNEVVVDFTLLQEIEIIDSSIVMSNGIYEAGWVIEELAVEESATLQFAAKSTGYGRFIAEVVSPTSDILVGRCFSSNCYPDDNFKCYYSNCTPEADEVLYPQEFAEVEITQVECSTTGEIGCGRNYNITLFNPSTVTSAPLNLFMRAFLGEAFYQQTGTTFPVPSIEANDSVTLNLDFGDCIVDRPFAQVQNLQLGLVSSNIISLFADGRQTAPEGAFVDLVNVSRCSYNNTTDVAVAVETDGIITNGNTATYQVILTNNGDEIAESLQITYATNIRGSDGLRIDFNGTTDYEMSDFSEDEESRNRFLDYDKYWNVQNLAPGETAILNVTVVVQPEIGQFSTNVSVNENSFLIDPNPDDNSMAADFFRSMTTDLELRLITEKEVLFEGEEGAFQFILSNQGTVAAESIVMALRLGTGDFTVVAGDDFNGEWFVPQLAAGTSDTLTFTVASEVPYLQLVAEIVQGNDDVDSAADNLLSGRCLGGDCFPETNIYCYYRCELEDDEVLYPSERYDLEFTQVECINEQTDVCNYQYEITLQNNTNIPSAPTSVILYHFINDGAPLFGDPSEEVVELPSLAPQESITLSADYGACRVDNSFETSQPILIALEDPSFVGNYFGRTPGNERETFIEVARCESEVENDFTDIELSVTTNRPDLPEYESGIFTYTLANTGNVDATGVTVEFYYENKVVPVGGVEVVVENGRYATFTDLAINEKTGRWENIIVPANTETTLQIELFSLTPALSFCAAVTAMDQDDVDSTPQSNCAAGEDDEVLSNSMTPFVPDEIQFSTRRPISTTIFPNPTRNVLHLGGQLAIDSNYQIINLFGRIIQSGVADGNEIDVQQLSNGTYFIQFENQQNAPVRFVKL